MNEQFKIENLSLVYNGDGDLICIRAVIDGFNHASSDLTNKNTIVIFSGFTKENRISSGIINCIEHGIYKEVKDKIDVLGTWFDNERDYLHVKIKINN